MERRRASQPNIVFRIRIAGLLLVMPFAGLLATTKTETAVEKIESSTEKHQPKSCSATLFKEFFDKFSESKDMEMQRKYTKFPLAITRYENLPVSLDYVKFEGYLKKNTAQFPLLLNKINRKKAGLDSVKIIKQGKAQLVSVYKANTDYQIDFYFSKETNGCWYLQKIDYGI